MPKTPEQVLSENYYGDMTVHAPFLSEVAKGDIFEIGVRKGFSTAALLIGLHKNGGHLWSMDIDPSCGSLFAEKDWTFIPGDSRAVVLAMREIPASLDILMIDGNHSYTYVKSDLANYAPLVKPGGLIIMHDVEAPPTSYTEETHEPFGVRRAFDEIDFGTKSIRSGSNGLGVIRV